MIAQSLFLLGERRIKSDRLRSLMQGQLLQRGWVTGQLCAPDGVLVILIVGKLLVKLRELSHLLFGFGNAIELMTCVLALDGSTGPLLLFLLKCFKNTLVRHQCFR